MINSSTRKNSEDNIQGRELFKKETRVLALVSFLIDLNQFFRERFSSSRTFLVVGSSRVTQVTAPEGCL